jgi:hypothetical protein
MSEEEIEKLSVDVRPVKALAERLLKQSHSNNEEDLKQVNESKMK